MSTTTNAPASTNQVPLQLPSGNVSLAMAMTATLSPASVAANTSAEQTFAITGLLAGDLVFVNAPALTAGLVIGNFRVSAANTLAISFGNLTASPIVPTASSVYNIVVLRPMTSVLTGGLPNSLPTP